MKIEELLKLGKPMLPQKCKELIRYDGPLVGTFEAGRHTVLFWSADIHGDSVMRYVYTELTDEEIASLDAYFPHNGQCENHPLLTGRRVVVGLSDEYWSLAHVAVIERSSKDVFAEVNQLFPVSND